MLEREWLKLRRRSLAATLYSPAAITPSSRKPTLQNRIQKAVQPNPRPALSDRLHLVQASDAYRVKTGYLAFLVLLNGLDLLMATCNSLLLANSAPRIRRQLKRIRSCHAAARRQFRADWSLGRVHQFAQKIGAVEAAICVLETRCSHLAA